MKDKTKDEIIKMLNKRIDKAIDKLTFIDESIENGNLNIPLCIVKINKTLDILKGFDTLKGEDNEDI